MSVTIATPCPTAVHDDTQWDKKETARRAAFPQPAGRFRRWWQVLGSNQRRLSRRFYRPLLPASFHASELRKHCQITFVIQRCPLTCIAAVTSSGSAVAPFTVRGRASLCSLALTAAGSCERAAGSGGAERPRSGAAGALDAAARERIMGRRGKGANRGPAVSGAGVGPFCWRPGVTCPGGTGSGGGSQAYLGPRALCRARRHDDRLGVPPPGGMRPLNLYRPSAWPCTAGPVAADSGLAGAGRGHAPSGEFGSGSPARRPRQDGPPWDGRAQAAVSASSPSPVRMWQAWRRILRAPEIAARLPSLRSLTCA